MGLAMTAELSAADRIQMQNLILIATAPIKKARTLLLKRYGKPAVVPVPQAIDRDMVDIVLPPEIASVDADLVQREQETIEIILKEYGQTVDSYNGWD